MTAKILVLIRHGKAQSRKLDVPDADRALTKAGVQALRAWLTKSARLLKDLTCAMDMRDEQASMEIWTSPAARTKTTADEVARAFGRDIPIVERESLLAQDESAFFQELSEADAAVVIAVGHNPFVEDVLAHLTGAHVGLATGAVAAVHLLGLPQRGTENLQEEGRLLWLVQGPRSQRWKTMLVIEETVRMRAKAMEERLAAFLEDADDVEALHKLRVSIRTLRSLLAFAAPFLRKKPYKSLQRDLRFIVGQTSRLREYDVLLEQAARLALSTEELQGAIVAARASERDRVVAFMCGKEAKRAFDQVREGVRDLPWKDAVKRYGIAPEDALLRFDELASGVEDGLATVDFSDEQAVHDLRKDAKRVRYVAENFGEVLDVDAAEQAQRMVGVQDRLGAVCDARVNIGIVCEFPTAGLSPESRRALGALLEQNMTFVERFLRENAH